MGNEQVLIDNLNDNSYKRYIRDRNITKRRRVVTVGRLWNFMFVSIVYSVIIFNMLKADT